MTVTIDKVSVCGETIYTVSCSYVVRYPLSFTKLEDAISFVKSIL